MDTQKVTNEAYACIPKVKYVLGCFALILSFCFFLAACSTMGVNETVRYEKDIAFCKNRLSRGPSPDRKRSLKVTI